MIDVALKGQETRDGFLPVSGGFRVGVIAELKRRNVIRMAGLYLVGAWLLV